MERDTEIQAKTYVYQTSNDWNSYDRTVWLQAHSANDFALHIIGRLKTGVFVDEERVGPVLNCIAQMTKAQAVSLYEALGAVIRDKHE